MTGSLPRMDKRFARPRLLPALIGVAALALVFRLGGLVGGASEVISSAQAQEAAASAGAEENVQPGEQSIGQPEPPRAEPVGAARNSTELSLIADLQARRKELAERERRAELREQLLASTEQRIDKKLEELKTVQTRVESLVALYEKKEDEQIQNVVKVYEAMRPKDAGPIFQRLDLDIQTAVATRMKKDSMAAVLAEMDPEAAKILTSELARRTPLPDLSRVAESGPDGAS